MIIGVPKESFPGERRVALVPAVIPNLTKAGFEMWVEAGAGHSAGYRDEDYAAKGAKIVPERAEVFRAADVIVQVLCYGSNDKTGAADLPLLRRGQILVGFLRPLGFRESIQEIAATGVSAFSIELMPRTTRAQSMDALSSMATICGYKAVLLAAETLPKIFPMLTTAAGTVTPARVFVIGAGVAGLQAIATARRLGAVASAYDLRPAAKEQVHSVGGRFVELPIVVEDAQDARGYAKAQDENFYQRQAEMLGNVLAAERGGNCEVTRPGEVAVEHDVTVIGTINLASTVPYHASQMYARNVTAFLLHLFHDGKLNLDLNDEIIRETLVTHAGEIVNQRVREFFSL
jgi:NAD(P) transhydrogenase subunit alpha